jgi:hypothetical protein
MRQATAFSFPGPFGPVVVTASGPGRARHDSVDVFVNPGEREYGDIMAGTVRDTSC